MFSFQIIYVELIAPIYRLYPNNRTALLERLALCYSWYQFSITTISVWLWKRRPMLGSCKMSERVNYEFLRQFGIEWAVGFMVALMRGLYLNYSKAIRFEFSTVEKSHGPIKHLLSLFAAVIVLQIQFSFWKYYCKVYVWDILYNKSVVTLRFQVAKFGN